MYYELIKYKNLYTQNNRTKYSIKNSINTYIIVLYSKSISENTFYTFLKYIIN